MGAVFSVFRPTLFERVGAVPEGENINHPSLKRATDSTVAAYAARADAFNTWADDKEIAVAARRARGILLEELAKVYPIAESAFGVPHASTSPYAAWRAGSFGAGNAFVAKRHAQTGCDNRRFTSRRFAEFQDLHRSRSSRARSAPAQRRTGAAAASSSDVTFTHRSNKIAAGSAGLVLGQDTQVSSSESEEEDAVTGQVTTNARRLKRKRFKETEKQSFSRLARISAAAASAEEDLQGNGRWGRERFAEVLRILDVGCGPGRDVLCFNRIPFVHCDGVDPCAEFVRKARWKLERNLFSHPQHCRDYSQSDARKMGRRTTLIQKPRVVWADAAQMAGVEEAAADEDEAEGQEADALRVAAAAQSLRASSSRSSAEEAGSDGARSDTAQPTRRESSTRRTTTGTGSSTQDTAAIAGHEQSSSSQAASSSRRHRQATLDGKNAPQLDSQATLLPRNSYHAVFALSSLFHVPKLHLPAVLHGLILNYLVDVSDRRPDAEYAGDLRRTMVSHDDFQDEECKILANVHRRATYTRRVGFEKSDEAAKFLEKEQAEMKEAETLNDPNSRKVITFELQAENKAWDAPLQLPSGYGMQFNMPREKIVYGQTDQDKREYDFDKERNYMWHGMRRRGLLLVSFPEREEGSCGRWLGRLAGWALWRSGCGKKRKKKGQTNRWSHDGRWISGMTAKEFTRMVEKISLADEEHEEENEKGTSSGASAIEEDDDDMYTLRIANGAATAPVDGKKRKRWLKVVRVEKGFQIYNGVWNLYVIRVCSAWRLILSAPRGGGWTLPAANEALARGGFYF
eukprot:g5928.t1